MLSEARFIPARAGNTGALHERIEGEAVHPRSRGEHAHPGQRRPWEVGSSPLARGTQGPMPSPAIGLRFIPARAGNTHTSPLLTLPHTVHPRSRGEHVPQALRTRETLRFIPARAGNTWKSWLSTRSEAVHPRSRGEHFSAFALACRHAGSSPLARGTPHSTSRGARQSRFIPARAGNTAGISVTASSSTVHPRSRGEHSRPAPGYPWGAGSSPLARGTPGTDVPGHNTNRFIPARAGNTRQVRRQRYDSAVHPRSRGEHGLSPHPHPMRPGSSPLARGTRVRCAARDTIQRFIPARAGNTDSPRIHTLCDPVHPRSRGEHDFPDIDGFHAPGSSPLARGTHFFTVSISHPQYGSSPLARGTRPRPRFRFPLITVHPRSRGEHRGCMDAEPGAPGSSPLARGTLACALS